MVLNKAHILSLSNIYDRSAFSNKLCLLQARLVLPSYNCGGTQATSYDDDDSEPSGAAKFHVSPTGNWAFSTTGVFIDGDQFGETYLPQNVTTLTMADSELYTNARGSPISLTYYGFCLANGSYTVKLHFAEIMFTDDQTYGSLRRRVFDIYL